MQYYFNFHLKYPVILFLLPYINWVYANSGWTVDRLLDDIKNNNGKALAHAARPLWHIGIECGNWPCYPDWATADRTDTGPQRPAAKLFAWPRMDSSLPDNHGCPYPGTPQSNNFTPFPTYYTVTGCVCNGLWSEFRVTYSIFFGKDGYAASGHDYDWEDITIIWRLDPTKSINGKNTFYRHEMLMERHGSRPSVMYTDIESTVKESSSNWADGQKNLDHPKVYIGSAHHAIFHLKFRSDDHCDLISDYDARADDYENVANRDDDWWYMASDDNLLYASGSSTLGQHLASFSWGKASSHPADLQSHVCSLPSKGSSGCIPASSSMESMENITRATTFRHRGAQMPLNGAD